MSKDTEELVKTTEEYRDHYIRIRIVATPPLPHDDETDGTIAARVKLYDKAVFKFFDLVLFSRGDLVHKWRTEINSHTLVDGIEDLIEQAKDRVDTRQAQHLSLCEATAIAVERALQEDGDAAYIPLDGENDEN